MTPGIRDRAATALLALAAVVFCWTVVPFAWACADGLVFWSGSTFGDGYLGGYVPYTYGNLAKLLTCIGMGIGAGIAVLVGRRKRVAHRDESSPS